MLEADILRTQGQVADNLARIQGAIADAAAQAGRRPEEITLVAVSKTQPPEAVFEAIIAGLRDFGENRVQEALQKRPAIARLLALGTTPGDLQGNPASLRWHMIGHLQTNKAAAAVGLFDSIDSVDSLRVAEALSRRVVSGGGLDLAVRLEVYVGDDPARPGLRPGQLLEVAAQIVELPGLRVEGLMTVAPLGGGDARVAFSQVRDLKQRLAERVPSVHFGVLSMGMSEDYQLAIQEGSTEIRLGTALFGPRQSR